MILFFFFIIFFVKIDSKLSFTKFEGYFKDYHFKRENPKLTFFFFNPVFSHEPRLI